MFDKKPSSSPLAGKEIDFLHTEGESKKKSKSASPVEFANVPPKKKTPRVSLKPTFLSRLASLFRKKRVQSVSPIHDKKVFVSPQRVETLPSGGKKIVAREVPKVESTPLQSVEEPHMEKKGPLPFFGQLSQGGDRVRVSPRTVESKGERATTPEGREEKKEPQDTPEGIQRPRPEADALKKMRLTEFSNVTEQKGVTTGAPRGQKHQKAKEEQFEESLDVNLLPEEKPGLSLKSKKIITLTVLCIEFLSLLFIYLVLQAKADGRMLGLRELESQATLLEIQMKQYKEVVLDARTLQRKVALLQTLLSERNDFNKAFAWLENHTLKSVYLENFNASADGSIAVHVVAADVVSAAQQMRVFLSSTEWESVEISGLSVQEDEEGVMVVSYDVGFVPTPSLYGKEVTSQTTP